MGTREALPSYGPLSAQNKTTTMLCPPAAGKQNTKASVCVLTSDKVRHQSLITSSSFRVILQRG